MRLVKLLLLSAILLSFSLNLTAQSRKDSGGSFRWAFLQLNDGEEVTVISENNESRSRLRRNSDYRFFFRPLKSAYLYILLLGPNDEVKLLFPSSFKDFSRRYETFEREIPEQKGWRHLFTSEGPYEMHVLVADSRLTELEKSLTRFNKLKSSEERLLVKSEILFTIKKLKRKQYFPDSVKREPVFEAGVIRSAEQQLEQYAERIDFKGLYGEVYYIE